MLAAASGSAAEHARRMVAEEVLVQRALGAPLGGGEAAQAQSGSGSRRPGGQAKTREDGGAQRWGLRDRHGILVGEGTQHRRVGREGLFVGGCCRRLAGGAAVGVGMVLPVVGGFGVKVLREKGARGGMRSVIGSSGVLPLVAAAPAAGAAAGVFQAVEGEGRGGRGRDDLGLVGEDVGHLGGGGEAEGLVVGDAMAPAGVIACWWPHPCRGATTPGID